jgi:hypothetical protein
MAGAVRMTVPGRTGRGVAGGDGVTVAELDDDDEEDELTLALRGRPRVR